MARIAGINIPQNKVVSIALTYIHGIGLHSSKKESVRKSRLGPKKKQFYRSIGAETSGIRHDVSEFKKPER